MRLQLDDTAYERPAPNVRCDLCAFGTALEVGEIACHYTATNFGVFAPDWWCDGWVPRGAKMQHIVPFWDPPALGNEP